MSSNTRNSPPQDLVEEDESKYSSPYSQELREYNIGTFEYPDGLAKEPYLQHYVAFFINVREKSEIYRRANETDGILPRASVKEKERLNALSTDETSAPFKAIGNAIKNNPENVALGAAALYGTAGLLKGIKSRNKSAGPLSSLAGAGQLALKSGAVGVGTYLGARLVDYANDQGFFKSIGFSSGRTQRLKEVITLNLEQRPEVRYSANYSIDELGSLAGLFTVLSASKSLDGAALSEAGAAVVSNLSKLNILGSSRSTIDRLRELSTRTKLNPFREVFFENINFRTFNFSYTFFPRSESESKKVNDIIKLFKTHMHPQYSATRAFYVYPSEFNITYYFGEKENQYLHKFATCALMDMNVEYGGDQFATFNNGAPVEIRLTLTFKELDQLGSKEAENGY